MPTRWTTEQIIEMAPDSQVARAARDLARVDRWRGLARAEQALWGEQQGSGKRPYLVAIDLDGPAFKCSCPSRKRPCKHAIALLLLARDNPGRLQKADPPEWVQTWLTRRAARAAGKVTRSEKSVPDSRAQARRARRRSRRVQQGVDALGRWTQDLVRQGLGSLRQQPARFWEEQAAQLVDAQAPGLARRVRELATIPVSGEGWPARLLDRLARLHLLLEAYARLETLSPELQEEVRAQVGWTQEQDTLRQLPGERDHWLVLSRRVSQEDRRLLVQRTWVWGVERRRAALLLDFAHTSAGFDTHFVPGTSLDAELVFWPGSFPLRALVKIQRDTRRIESLPGYPSIPLALSAYGDALAHNPWLDRFLMPLEQVVPLRQGDSWIVGDVQDYWLPLALPPAEGWRLLALSGGHPTTLSGEWDGQRLTPLSVWTGSELVPIGGHP